MRKALPKIAKLAVKLANGEEIGTPKDEGYIARGIRVNYFHEDRGSKRAVDMLVKKIKVNHLKLNTQCQTLIELTQVKL